MADITHSNDTVNHSQVLPFGGVRNIMGVGSDEENVHAKNFEKR